MNSIVLFALIRADLSQYTHLTRFGVIHKHSTLTFYYYTQVRLQCIEQSYAYIGPESKIPLP